MSRLPVSLAVIIGVLLVGLGVGLNGAAAQAPTPAATIENSSEDVRLQLNYDGGLLVPGTYDPPTPADSIPTTGAGTRMMWYPAKAAFRAGGIDENPGTEWDAGNIGRYSVAFGEDTEASGFHSMAVGLFSKASDTGTLAVGAFGPTASGYSSVALGEATTASGNHAVALGNYTTAATPQSLTIGECNSANRSSDNSLIVAGNGQALDCQSDFEGSDALVLDKDGNLTIEGTFTDELGTFAGHIQGDKNQTDANGPDSHVALVENTNSGFSASGLAIQTGDTDPVGGNNFLTFYGGDDEPVGSVDGNGQGGVNYESGGADFAEELPVAETAGVPEPKDLVGVRGGTIRLETERADRVMIVSSGAAVTGNVTPESEDGDARRAPVAFVGQVPVRLRGTADVGDLVVASGEHDGTARAVAPSAYRRADHGPIAGQVWSAKTTEDIGPVTVAVGIGSAGRTAAERLHEQQKQIEDLQKRVQKLEDLEQRLARVEAKASGGSMMAGLSGSGLLAVVLLALGTALGAGIFWRRR